MSSFDHLANKWYKYEMYAPEYHQLRLLENKWKSSGWQIWPAAFFTAKYLEMKSDAATLEMRGKKVLELGAGCGLVSLVAANLGAKVTATDSGDVLPILQMNCETSSFASVSRPSTKQAQASSASVEGGSSQLVKLGVDAKEIEWGIDIRSEYPRGTYDLILGSDLFCEGETHIPLFLTLLQLFGPTTVGLISHVWRRPDRERHFLDRLSKYFSIHQVAGEEDIKDFAKQQLSSRGVTKGAGLLRRGSSIDVDTLTAAEGDREGDGEPLVVLEIRLKRDWAANIPRLEAETARLLAEAGMVVERGARGGIVSKADQAGLKAALAALRSKSTKESLLSSSFEEEEEKRETPNEQAGAVASH
uniref:Uncharacterized protein n=1 Tax=Chromera velia CCMP2878 TaxID=1169474 RepID=A0A0G4HQF1_9ALVE|eukprot:Cvel_7931.t1-p1 / transcript=Cvel_7931.t1 / gene=Cvel_7931 / organism=Chromera_velia_CCMP2878 / gene_product=Protein-lysine methyltransferase METTL21A, putative / transcript_product=Protein-lysine methyltransferase METTL21A, putative / location=Cvel_scaffold425:72243-75854(-) / protein_length=359 / sequence_SO=supercontig / SO=protein_coding / is_pseudo=false